MKAIRSKRRQLKRTDKIVREIIILLLGAMIYGFIGAALEAYGNRSAGNIGGEIFVLPLMIGLVWLGWELRKNYHK